MEAAHAAVWLAAVYWGTCCFLISGAKVQCCEWKDAAACRVSSLRIDQLCKLLMVNQGSQITATHTEQRAAVVPESNCLQESDSQAVLCPISWQQTSHLIYTSKHGKQMLHWAKIRWKQAAHGLTRIIMRVVVSLFKAQPCFPLTTVRFPKTGRSDQCWTQRTNTPI